MKCKECGKVLNNMSVICDSCGTKVAPSETPKSMDAFFNQIVVQYKENELSKECKANIKDIYFLTHELKRAKGLKKRYLKKMIEMNLFRIFYETEKKYLLTKKYEPKDALLIFDALYNQKMDQEVIGFLKTVYAEEMEQYILPEDIVLSIPKVYINDVYKKVSSIRAFMSYTLPILKKSIKYLVIFGLLTGVIYQGIMTISLPVTLPSFEQSIILGALFGVLLGIYPGFKETKHIAIKQHMKENKAFKSHINKYAKDKIKNLRLRIKKGDV
jgi:hypothetical protein